jgi:hypothetical protein
MPLSGDYTLELQPAGSCDGSVIKTRARLLQFGHFVELLPEAASDCGALSGGIHGTSIGLASADCSAVIQVLPDGRYLTAYGSFKGEVEGETIVGRLNGEITFGARDIVYRWPDDGPTCRSSEHVLKLTRVPGELVK